MNTTDLLRAFPWRETVPTEFRIETPIHQSRVLINGEFLIWQGPVKDVISPIYMLGDNEELLPTVIGSIPQTGEHEALSALGAATLAYDNGHGVWPKMSLSDRIVAVLDFVKQMSAQRQAIVRLLMWEIGKNLADSQKEFDRTIDYIHATIKAVRDLDNENSCFHVVEGTIGQIRRTPLGVVLCLGPYNYPLNETFATMIPALIMGNTIVFKPPKWGVLLFDPLLDAFRSAFPKGVINFVYGDGEVVVPRLLQSGAIDVLSLIGSSRVANDLKKAHPKVNRLRAVLGLEAKNAAIILPDADIEATLKECIAGALSFNGQRCTALKILIVHRLIAAEFINRLVQEVGKLRIGMPWEQEASITPLPSAGKVEHMTALIEDAKAKGAEVINEGGGQVCGTIFAPAVVYPVVEGMRLYREEQFGPIVPVMIYDDVETAVDYVTTSDHGQQVSIFGSDPVAIGRLTDELINQVCRVNINCQCQRGPDAFPFTGRKDSAEGTLSVIDALRCFSIRSMIATKQTDASKKLFVEIVSNQSSNFINTRFIL